MLDKLKGELRVFTKEVKRHDGSKRVMFNSCVGSTKVVDEDDNVDYINYYMPVNFSKAVKKQVTKVYKNESFDIIIKEAWIKAYVGSDEYTHPILFINDAKVISIDEDEEEDKPKAKKSTSTKKTSSKKPAQKTSSKKPAQKKSSKEELEPTDDDNLPF